MSLPPESSSKAVLFVACALTAFALGAGAAWLWRSQPTAGIAGTFLQEPRAIADFALQDQDGRAFGRAHLAGRWTLAFLGFANCPDVCPTTLALMKELEARMSAAGRPVQMLFVSVDPERDTLARLQQYVRHFSPTMAGVTGETSQLDALAASLGLAYVKVPGASARDYSVDHSAALVLINPRAEVAGYFSPPLKLDAIAADLSAVVDRS